MNREELAWAAGLFDGEGCFTYGGRVGYPVVRMTQISREVLDRFHLAVMGIGRVAGPYKNGGRKQAFHYYAYGPAKTQAIGAMLWMFLSTIKRIQFARVMASADWAGLTRTPEHRSKIGFGIKSFYRSRRKQQQELADKGQPGIILAR